jgi:hypothetical protein
MLFDKKILGMSMMMFGSFTVGIGVSMMLFSYWSITNKHYKLIKIDSFTK